MTVTVELPVKFAEVNENHTLETLRKRTGIDSTCSKQTELQQIGITNENLLNQLDTTKKEQLYSNEVHHPNNEAISTVVTSAKLRSNQFSYFSYIVVLMTTVLLAFATRWYKISAGKFVLWDEAHFGKFGSQYLQRAYYIDLHPPLAKMLVGLGLYLAKFDNSFPFESSKPYPENIDYVSMRKFTSSLGALAVPILFSAAHNLGLSKWACLLVASFALFDNGLIGVSRPILLDSTLLLFTSLTAYFLIKFIQCTKTPFSLAWFWYLCCTGISIGLVASSKWVGLFSVALVGFYTVWDLWSIWGNKKRSLFHFAGQFTARAFFLIIVPILIYMAVFWIHFKILNETGTGDAQMSSLFQASLKFSKVSTSPIEVVYGSQVAIKSQSNYAGLLHSHIQRYPSGSFLQQVTIYHHRDNNNHWRIESANEIISHASLTQIQNGDKIRLVHTATNANLRAQKMPAPITKSEYEVSCSGGPTEFDENDFWIVEFTGKPKSENSKGLRTLFTSFRLKHSVLNCYLHYTTKHLPEWGFKQGEVTCSKENDTGKDTIWNIEENVNKRLKEPEASSYKSNFIDDFIDLNTIMYRNNNMLVNDPEVVPSLLTSNPIEWPFLYKGIRMCGWDENTVKFYMFLNPIGGWICLICLAITAGILIKQFLLNQRYRIRIPHHLQEYSVKFYIGLAGWSLHYFPFFVMGRVLYFHHYYPAYLFAILNLGVLFDYFSARYLTAKKQKLLSLFLIALIAASFLFFSPLCYGMDGPISNFKARKWFSTWL